MDLLNEMITDASENAAKTKVSFNQVLMEALREAESLTYSEVLKLNIKFRFEKKFGSEVEFNEEGIKANKDEVQKFIGRAKKQLRGTISKAQDIGGFNYWAESKGKDIQIKWDDAKNIEIA